MISPRRLSIILVVVLFGGIVICTSASAADEGFVGLLGGKNLDGWVVDGRQTREEDGQKKPIWTVEQGVVHGNGRGGGFLRYDKELGDFIVRLEYRMSKGCNSGLGIRGTVFTGQRNTRPSIAGYEIQILDDAGREPGKHSSGSLYRYVAPSQNAAKPAGQWNAVEIECRGPRIRIVLNGQTIHALDQTTVDAIKDKPLRGYFSLQDHGKQIEFRNVRLKEL